MVAGGGFYSYYIHQGNKSDKEWKIVRKKLIFMYTKRFNNFFLNSVWVQSHVYPIGHMISPFGGNQVEFRLG